VDNLCGSGVHAPYTGAEAGPPGRVEAGPSASLGREAIASAVAPAGLSGLLATVGAHFARFPSKSSCQSEITRA